MTILDRRWVVAVLVGACTALAVAHALAVWPHYHVGSFDDDAGYVMAARAIAHGHGLTSTLPAGVPLVASYPPGYAALLAPIAVVSGTAYAAFRGLSVGLMGLLLPLTWVYLRRRGVGIPAALATLVLLALNPVLGTFAEMIMAELPFLVLLMLVLLALDRWESSARVATWAGVGAIAGAAGLLWLKEAAAGLVAGMVVWLLLRRLWPKAVALGGGVTVLFLPILVARLVTGTSPLGSRYTTEYGTAFASGIVHLVAHSLSTYANVAIPQTIVPTSVSPLPIVGHLAAALGTFGTLSTPLVLIGSVVWWRRHRDVMCVAVPVYLLETLVFPFTNERRLVLILPVVLVWYVLGWIAVIGWAGRILPAIRPVAWLAPSVALVILIPQFGRNYLYLLGHGSSQPRGSPYMTFLSRVGNPHDVVETDYVWTTSLFSGHRAAATAFFDSFALCYGPAMETGLTQDDAAFLLSGAFSNVPGPGDPCLLEFAATDPAAIRLFRTAFDDASVFEFVGPGTPHPDLIDLTAGPRPSGVALSEYVALPQGATDVGGLYPVEGPVGGQAVVTWTWGRPAPVSQVSVGMAFSATGRVSGVDVQLRLPDGRWQPVASAPGAIGDGGVVPFLLVPLGHPVTATALRVVARSDASVAFLDVHALGSR